MKQAHGIFGKNFKSTAFQMAAFQRHHRDLKRCAGLLVCIAEFRLGIARLRAFNTNGVARQSRIGEDNRKMRCFTCEHRFDLARADRQAQ